MHELAINIADLTSHAALALLLGPYLTRELVAAEPGMLDGLAARVNQAVPLTQLAALLETLRALPGGGKHQVQVYQRIGARWERIEQLRLEPMP